MGVPRTVVAITVGSNPPTPVYTGTPVASASAYITNGTATIILGAALPATGFSGPNQFIQGVFPAPNGQQVTLYGFGSTFGPLFNGKQVTVISNNPALQSFSFYYNHANIGSAGTPTADTAGFAAPAPTEHYRAVRIECSQALSTDTIYVGDGFVSSTRYVAALSLAGQLSVEIASDNIPAERVWITGTGSTDGVQISLIH